MVIKVRCGKAMGRSGNIINPKPGQGTYMYLLRSCTYILDEAGLRDGLETF